MLLKDELEFFLDYYKMRLEEDKTLGGGLLLSHPVHLKGLLADDELFAPIRKLLKAITKDETILLYHLRHSLLTRLNTLIQLTERHHMELPGIAPPLEEIELVRNLFAYLYGNEHSGRKGLYFLAMLAGHVSPDTTNHHYCHLLDLLLGHHLNDPANSISPSKLIVMALTGLKRSTAYELITPEEEVEKGINPLHDMVANESGKYRDKLRHPMLQSELSIEGVTPEHQNVILPPWEEAIGFFAGSKNMTLLHKDKDEWGYAAALYERIRTYDGRKMKTVRKVVEYISQNYNARHGGITIRLASEAKQLRSFTEDKKMPKAHIVAIHHPAKSLTTIESEEMREKWAGVLGVSQRLISVGEHVPAKSQQRSTITIKFTIKENREKKIRAQRMSSGFIAVIEILKNIFRV
jgi:hypothetical protein